MPDITMCAATDCPLSPRCRRHEDSGTVPSEWRQSWFASPPHKDGECGYFWPVKER